MLNVSLARFFRDCSRPFAFVNFETEEAAAKAMAAMQGEWWYALDRERIFVL